MRHIYKIYYETTPEQFEKIYRSRLSYDSTVRLGLFIKPRHQANLYELYYVPTNRMIEQVNRLQALSGTLTMIYSKLPPVARRQFIHEHIVEELYHTNTLEGVNSSREEIAESTRHIETNKSGKTRFGRMIKSYLRLLNGEFAFPQHPNDIRKIYDEITEGEIARNELPDGEIFRKDVTYVKKETGDIIHLGITPESRIIEGMKDLLQFMNQGEDIPLLIKVAVGHYYFGYIHPFYDGNGRTSRFISSMYLTKALGHLSALALSSGCNTFKKKYYKAFEMANSLKNRGEMNHFIETFFEILISALEVMNGDLKEKDELLRLSLQKLERDSILRGQKEIYKSIMFVLAQNHFFAREKGLTVKELAELQGKSTATIRNMMKNLLEWGLIEQQGARPAYYLIKEEYFTK